MATLESKTILIIGGSSGIGYGVAEASLASRASLVIIVSSNSERVSNAVKRLEAANVGTGKVQGEVVDASDHKALKEFLTRIGEVDHIVLTSGKMVNFFFPCEDLEGLKSVFDLRFWTVVVVAQNAKIRKGASLTLTTGSAMVKPRKTFSIGAGIAGSVDSLARGLAVDLAPIRVNVICPGLVNTELLNAFPKERMEALISDAERRLLVKHIGQPAEVAEAYLFVMKCSYITGQRIEVDGGILLAD